MKKLTEIFKDVLIYKKEKRAMLFSGILTVSELYPIEMICRAVLSEEEIKNVEFEVSKCSSRFRCLIMIDEKHQCEIFQGHPGDHIAMAYLTKKNK